MKQFERNRLQNSEPDTLIFRCYPSKRIRRSPDCYKIVGQLQKIKPVLKSGGV